MESNSQKKGISPIFTPIALMFESGEVRIIFYVVTRYDIWGGGRRNEHASVGGVYIKSMNGALVSKEKRRRRSND